MWKGKSKSGKDVTLLTPSEKVTKAVQEIKLGYKITNDGQVKLDEFGQKQMLTAEERAYRGGVISQATDSQKAFKASNPNYKRKTKTMPTAKVGRKRKSK